jgi:hypothetical protein
MFIINQWLEWRFRGKRGLGMMARGKKGYEEYRWVVKPGDRMQPKEFPLLGETRLGNTQERSSMRSLDT